MFRSSMRSSSGSLLFPCCVLCGDVSSIPTHISTQYAMQAYQTYAAAKPQWVLDIFSKFKLSNLNKEIKKLPEDDLIEDRNMSECFKCFKCF